MKRKITVEMLEASETHKANLYVIRFEDEDLSEFDKFCNAYENDDTVEWEYNVIDQRLTTISQLGAEDEHFRPEGKAIKALPSDVGALLRLYCYRIDVGVLILGNGGIKEKNLDGSKNKLKHFPHLHKFHYVVKAVGQQIQRDLANGNIQRTGNVLTEMKFEIEI